MTGGEAVVLGRRDVVKTKFWSYMWPLFGWRARVSGTVT
jgi:hypothetical protein